jgi:orotate phosphoribosyltransferase
MVNKIRDLLINAGAIEFGEFTLASGASSKYYVDIKTASTNPQLLSAIAAEVAGRASFDAVAGVAVGGVPLAVAVALHSGKPFAIIRQAEKSHGKSGAIIGSVSGRRVLLVEDVTTSGGSALYGVRTLRQAGAVVDQVITVVDREEGASEAFRNEGIELLALVRASEIRA